VLHRLVALASPAEIAAELRDQVTEHVVRAVVADLAARELCPGDYSELPGELP
jgi:hypothetical protein